MNDRLRSAFDNEPVPNDLEARLRARLDQTPQGAGISRWWLVAACLAMLAIAIGISQHAAQKKITALLGIGVSDHVHCAVAGVYPHQTRRVEMIDGLGPQFAPMLEPVVERASAGRPKPDAVESAHRCTVNGRAYVHIILRRDGMLISVILTRRSDTETFPLVTAARILHASGNASGIPLHDASLDGYSVSGFESGAWLGYVVSGFPVRQNDALAARVAPVVRGYAR